MTAGSRPVSVLGAALVMASLTSACEGVLPEPDFERMQSQRNVRPYGEAAMFADGRAMRSPPAGTVSRDRLLGAPALTDGVVGGQYVESIPLGVDRALLARGRDRFDVFCATCHGIEAAGVSPVAHVMELRRPPSLVAPPVTGFPSGRLFQVVSLGYGLMPAYATELEMRDRWAVVAYVQALQLRQGVPLASLPTDLRVRAQEALR
jgi:mono/diheme cytochrome c family protein